MLHPPPSARGCSPSISAPGRMLSWENSLSSNVPAVRGWLVPGLAQRDTGSGAVLAGGAARGLTRLGRGAPACVPPCVHCCGAWPGSGTSGWAGAEGGAQGPSRKDPEGPGLGCSGQAQGGSAPALLGKVRQLPAPVAG